MADQSKSACSSGAASDIVALSLFGQDSTGHAHRILTMMNIYYCYDLSPLLMCHFVALFYFDLHKMAVYIFPLPPQYKSEVTSISWVQENAVASKLSCVIQSVPSAA